jgi:hypothetical protein
MSDTTNLDLAFYSLLLAVVAIVCGFQIRFYLRRFLSQRWPTASATIRKGFIGTVSRGAGAGFYEYVFAIKGEEYLGKFIILDSWEHAEKLQEKLDGLPISIRFCPTNPAVSLLVDLYDPRFDGKLATQNPYWYANARERDSFLALELNKK